MNNKKNIKLIIEYDGSNYSGWQIQNNSVTIQGVIKKALEELTHERIDLIGSSRTDAGVHAYGQVANFFTSSNIPADKISFALNNRLPKDIVVINSSLATHEFHARFSAKGKTYRYIIYNRKAPLALMLNRALHYPFSLNIKKMIDATKCFLGTHDFSSFRASKCGAKSCIKNINTFEINIDGDHLIFEITGNGFLYNMVRILVGTILEVGCGRLEVEEIDSIIKAKDRKFAGKTVSACGLYLCKVNY